MNLKDFARDILHSGVQDIDPDLWNRIMNTTDDMRTSIAPCVKCGTEAYNIRYSQETRDTLIMTGQCFSCNHWYEMTHFFPDGYSRDGSRRQVIVEGQHYSYDTLNPIKDKSIGGFLGFGGREWHIKFPDRDSFIVTNDLWCQGTIPEIWLPEFPDNATFAPVPDKYAQFRKDLAEHFDNRRKGNNV
jgi:hypothetical protein